jgi:hypothetical protein
MSWKGFSSGRRLNVVTRCGVAGSLPASDAPRAAPAPAPAVPVPVLLA